MGACLTESGLQLVVYDAPSSPPLTVEQGGCDQSGHAAFSSTAAERNPAFR